MVRYVSGRLLAMALTLFIIVTISFAMLRLMPGNIFENPDIPQVVREALNAKYHLDKPIMVQYGYFLRGVLADGDWGTSIVLQPTKPVFDILWQRIPVSMHLNIVSLLISLPLGMLFGILAALGRNRAPDHAISFAVVMCISIPSFVFAAVMQYFLCFRLGWFPIIYRANQVGWEYLRQIVMPVLALSFGPIAATTRFLRGELIETLSSEFMMLARTKGLTHFHATVRHALRNSLVPMVNSIVGMFVGVLTGSLVIERIFAIPGVGGIMLQAINALDHPVTIAALIFYSLVSLLSILIVDLLYGVVDPRIRMGSRR
ncbi:MAG: ABC transporter permease [Symbiobacteriaceae bacterium]|nr:ABC transporter permease [Symbiobacteriaceae bacterium]